MICIYAVVRLLAIPNGNHGIRISGDSFANTIGPFNIISGNNGPNSDGINISGMVVAPNVVNTNVIGPASGLIVNLGNGRTGVSIDSRLASIAVPEAVTLGPLNIIGYNGEDGVLITGTSEKIRVFGNFIGVAEDPVTPGSILDFGNVRDGIHITTPGHQIGGASIPETNVISANNKSGITLVAGAHDMKIQGNIIGRDPFNLINFPNTLDGITIQNTGSTTIGGTGAGEGNVIAGNGRHGVKITSGGSGWANLITRNSIFGNGPAVQPPVPPGGLGIDLDVTPDGVDPTDNVTSPGADPNIGYSNLGQSAPVISTGVNAPSYNPSTGATTVNWTLDTSPSTPVTLEFFGNDVAGFQAHGEGKKYLGTFPTTTDGAGHASGSFAITPPTAFDARGKFITMTATPANVRVDRPGATPVGPANNTSEFSNASLVPNPGIVQFSIAAYGVSETGGTATITATRTGGSDGIVSVDYATSDGTATQPADYGAATGTLTWADGDAANKTFTVSIVNDTIHEPNETVNLALSNPIEGVQIGPQATAIFTILDADPIPSITISDVAALEGNAATTPFVFNVTLSNPSSQTVTVNFATAEGTATQPSDYTSTAGTLTFLPGVTAQAVTVNVNADATIEPDETFAVNLTAPANATIAKASGLGTIQNDDSSTPTFNINSVMLAEGNAGTTAFVFTVTLAPAAAVPVTVQAATADGTATVADGDYVANTQPLFFAAGITTQTFTVLVNGDSKFEPNETFTVNLSANSAGTALSPTPGTGTITNDDVPAALTITTASPLTTATLGVLNTQPFAATGGTPPFVNWVVSAGTPPPNLTLDPVTGILSGTPTTLVGSPFSFTITVTDSAGATASKAFVLAVGAAGAGVTSVPTLDDWALAILALLVLAFGMRQAMRSRGSAR